MSTPQAGCCSTSPNSFFAMLPPPSYGVAQLCRRFDWRWPRSRINPFSLSPRALVELRHDRGPRAAPVPYTPLFRSFSRCCRHRATGSLSFAAASIGDGLGAGLTPSLYPRAGQTSEPTTHVDAAGRLLLDIAEFLFRDAAATELRGRSALPPLRLAMA